MIFRPALRLVLRPALPIALGIFLMAELRAAPSGPEVNLRQPEYLDTKAIHTQYSEGDFDAVIQALDGFMQRNRNMSLEDSVFIAKHLAVVYSANPATREKGRYYMHRLLEVLPSAKLVDMYVSEEIERIFEKVREESATRKGSHADFGRQPGVAGRQPDSSARPVSGDVAGGDIPEAKSAIKSGKKREAKTAFWIAGGTGLVVAGLAGYYFLHEAPEAGPDKEFNVPSR